MVTLMRTESYWIKEYKRRGALWIHDGNTARPHALLTSGNHSDGFFDSQMVVDDVGLLAEAANCLIENLGQRWESVTTVKCVVGPPTGGTKLAQAIRVELLVKYFRQFSVATPSKCEIGGKKSFVFADVDVPMINGNQVLLCDDVLTTGGSFDLVVDAVTQAGGTVLPVVLVLVNRSGLSVIAGRRIFSLIDRPMPIWTADECLRCKQGSKALRPKEGDNWRLLNQLY